MPTRTEPDLARLYIEDETAWLDAMSALVAQGEFERCDRENLSEYLSSMANRDRREVHSRLVVLLTHLLKWEHQPEKRTRSWSGTIVAQRQELREDVESRTLYNHAVATLEKAYQSARRRAAAETGLPLATFPPGWEGSVDDLIADDARDLAP